MKRQDVLKELKWRGIINNITDEEKLLSILNSRLDFAVYCGFDPSFKSLHLGNYVMMRVLSIFKKYGIKTIAVVGGGTGMIGDPSGKSQERNLLDDQTVLNNVKAVSEQLIKYTQPDFIFNNAEIWSKMNVIDYLRSIGKHFNVNTMLEKDIIKSRLETGISYTEFSYSILQSYDWVELYERYNACIQCGGSDQWGNLTAGVNLFRKIYGEEHNAVGLTINLLLRADGKKFGKSENGAIYFDKEITTPYTMYQFLLNQSDNDLLKLFNFFSDYEEDEIKKIIDEHTSNPKLRYGQNKLAECIVSAIHGKDTFIKCQQISKIMFEEKYDQLNEHELTDVLSSYQTINLDFKNDMNIINFFKENNIIPSNREIRTLIEQKGLKINGKLIENENIMIKREMFIHNKYLLIKKGKKNFFVIKIN